MKKSILIFAAIVLMAGFTSNIMAQDTKSNNANASILGAITLTVVAPLDFGGITPGAGGTVVLTAAGTATPAGVTLVAGVAPTAASYTVTGTGLATYAITIPTTDVIITNTTIGSATMAVSAMNCSKGGTSTFIAAGTDAFTVGGTLTVASAQVAGVYSGPFDVTVAYN